MIEYVKHITAVWHNHYALFLSVKSIIVELYSFHFLDVKVHICAFDIDFFTSVWFQQRNEVIYFHVYHNLSFLMYVIPLMTRVSGRGGSPVRASTVVGDR